MESSQINEKTESQNENSKNEEELEQKKVETIFSGCAGLIPLKFVDTIERLYHTLFNKTKYGSLNTLSSYKESHIRKIDLIEFELKSQNSSKLLRKMNDINCIKIAGDKLYTGDKSGIVYMYQIDKGLELEGFGVPGFNSPVSTIDNKGNEYLLIGYENGTINLFDVKKNFLIKSINDIHKTKILALKFVSIEKNSFQVISSDEEGQVMFINSSNSMLSKKTVPTSIFKESEPTYGITKFKPYENERLTFLAFALTNKVHLYTLEPKLNPIFEIKKPKYAEINDIPDISLGWGVRPIQVISQKKTDEKREKEILLAIGWGRVISLYGFLNKGDNYRIEGPIGFYINNETITRVGFFSVSIIYFFDKNSQIKSLNTAFFNYGKYEDNRLNANNNALIDEGEKFKNMKFNNISSIKEKEYNYYRNFIYNMKKSIYLFTNEGLRIGKILNYKECINNIIKNGNNWISALCLAIDIYKGNYNNFMGVPLDDKERKEVLYPYLIHLLNRYIDYNFNVDNEQNSEIDILSSSSTPDNNISEIKDEKIMECINVSIEFCIEIKSVDYLLKDVERTFSRSGKSDLFYKFFEPFIFSDLLLKEDIGIDALTSLYSAYKMKDELVLLSHLYTHLKLICLNNFALKKLAVKEKLFDVITFIFAHGDCCEDFFFPITKMFYAYSKEVQKENAKREAEKNNEDEYFSYYDLYLKKGVNGINKMEKCKEYIGHKLLWYIEMCLKGKKFASPIEADLLEFQTGSIEYKKFISYIYFWILQEQIFKDLLEFDSYSLFSVLIPFFIDPKIIKIIKNFDFSTINVDLLQKLVKEQEDNSYLMRAMANALSKAPTMVQHEKPDENKVNNALKSSLTIMPGKTNIEPSIKEKLENIKEEDNKKEEKQDEAQKGNKKENPKENKDKKKETLENIDPFASSKGATQYGQGVKLNDLNSVLEYIIKIVESQPSDLSHLDLDAFLIKYAAKSTESIPPKIREKILKGFENLLNFFSENKRMRKDLIAQHKDKFDIHNFSKKHLDPKDFYFDYTSKILNELLKSKLYTFTQDELYNLKSAASGTKFTDIKIKIAELSKRYNECLDIYIKQEDQKKKEEIFPWMEGKIQYFLDEINEERKKITEKEEKNNDNKINLLKKDLNNFEEAIIDKVYELTKIRMDKTKRLMGKYFTNTEKYKVYKKMEKDPEVQFEFLDQLLYQIFDEKKKQKEEEEEGNLTENLYDEQQNRNLDLFKIYKENKNENEKNKEEKKVREEFDKLLLDQIHLLIVLKRKPEIKKKLEKNIGYYPNYPMREALKECVENNITDSAVYIFQSLGENRNALNLTKQNLEESFKLFIQNPSNNKDFAEKLQVCIKICKENSESLMKKFVTEKESKEQNKEGEELWFVLLKRLYEFEEELEKKDIEENNKKLIQSTLQKSIEDLLKQMCLHVSIQNLVGYVISEREGRAQYKEFKSILESMLRSNTSFDRVLHSVIAILKDSIENSESKRKKVTSKGHNYFYKKCDVCNKLYINSRTEIIYCFGCGHQSHEKCCHRKFLKNENENRIINDDEEEENFIPECEVCRKNKIENRNKWADEDENIKNVQDVIEEDTEQNKVNAPSDKSKTFKFGNKKDKLKKIERYDKSYQNEVSMFY